MWRAGATLHRGVRASHYRGLSLWSTGSRCAGSVVVAHRPSCSAACGIFPDQGSNPCPLHWQADSQPLRHQGSPHEYILDHLRITCRYHNTSSLNANLLRMKAFSYIIIQLCHSGNITVIRCHYLIHVHFQIFPIIPITSFFKFTFPLWATIEGHTCHVSSTSFNLGQFPSLVCHSCC